MNEIIILFVILGWVSTMLKSIGEGFMRKIPKPPEHLRPSKSRLKKCNKGLHEFLKSDFTTIDKHTISSSKWACKHCGLLMHSRSNSFYRN
jgi:hypothetical protein